MAITRSPTLLIVGSNGFIGSAIFRKARQLGWDVYGLNPSPPNYVNHLEPDNYIHADITKKETLSQLSDMPFDYIVNAAGYINHKNWSLGGDAAFKAHFYGITNLVESISRKTLKRFVNIGSSDEYGGAPAPQVEIMREQPISPYALGKAAATKYLQMLHISESFPSGPYDYFYVMARIKREIGFCPT